MSWWPFHSKCPIDDQTRIWVDDRMEWLDNQFGLEQWWNMPLIEPTDEFFPDPFDSSEASVRRMLDRICRYMGVDPDRIILRLYADGRDRKLTSHLPLHQESQGAAGTYAEGASEDGRSIVSIARSTTGHAAPLVAVIAHELAHARHLGEKRISPDEPDHEDTTDLATVFFGLGVFNANAVAQFQQWSTGNMSGWRSSRIGYLDEPIFGYALALWAYVRGLDHPTWMRLLRPGPRAAMSQSSKYLQATPENRFANRRKRL